MSFLKSDIISYKRTVYGKAGDKVTVVARHGEVWIVEDAMKERFPVRWDLVAEITVTPAAAPPAAAIEKAAPVKRSKKEAPKTQTDLFN